MFPGFSPSFLLKKNTGGIRKLFMDSYNSTAFFYSYGTIALLQALRIMEIKKGDRVLIPAYICKIVLLPFLKLGVDIEFYKTDFNLRPVTSDIKSKIDSKTKALIVVNYFGFPQKNMDAIKAICKKFKIYIVEDNAHGYLSSYKGRLLGTFGDIGFSCAWKVLPMRDGAFLFINNSKLISKLSSTNCHLPVRLLTLGDIKFCLNSIFIYFENHGIFPIDHIRGLFKIFSKNKLKIEKKRRLPDSKVSWLSKAIIQKFDYKNIINKRRENFLSWNKFLKGQKGIEIVHTKLEEGVCPQIFPVIVQNTDSFIKKMRDGNVSIYNWPDLPKKIIGNPEFKIENFLAQHLFALPIHQDCNISTYSEKNKFYK
jgi:dTDP-4-amino-4,6-dideoxygalactose transaminase